jgi:hypothetical protein
MYLYHVYKFVKIKTRAEVLQNLFFVVSGWDIFRWSVSCPIPYSVSVLSTSLYPLGPLQRSMFGVPSSRDELKSPDTQQRSKIIFSLKTGTMESTEYLILHRT